MRTVRTRRRAIFRTSVFVTTAAIGVGLAPAAFADTPAPETVASITTNTDGTVAVHLSGTVTPDWLQVTVKASAAADAANLYTTKDVTESTPGGTVDATTNTLVSLPAGTGYGDYPVEVDFQLPGAAAQHWSADPTVNGNWLNYRKHASVTDLLYDRANTDWWHRTAVLSGHVTLLDPATGQNVPAPADTGVRLDWAEQQSQVNSVSESADVRTDAAGDFRYSTQVDGAVTGGSAYVRLAAPDITPGKPGQVPELPVIVTQYRLTAAPSPSVVHRGSLFKMQGKVEQLTTSGWQPFPSGALVYTATRAPDYTTNQQSTGMISAGGTTDSGTYSYPITGYNTTVMQTYLYPSPYLVPAGAQSTVYVPTAGSITSPKFTIDEFARVKATGQLTGNCSNQPVDFQYSPNGRTGWRTIAHAVTGPSSGGHCSYSLGPVQSGYDGWYRVYHSETKEMLAVSTQTPRLSRTRTAMSIAVSSTRPYNHSRFTASGVVTQLTSAGWVHENRAHVVLLFRPKGDTQWYWVVKGYTNSAGRYSFNLNTGDFVDGNWAAYLDTDSSHFYSQTKQIWVDIR